MGEVYIANEKRYERMQYNRCGNSGLMLPAISLGLWHNFGDAANFANMQAMLRAAFDLGITHFDIANNYGPPPGSAEENFGILYKKDFVRYRDELIISSKAGWDMWPGPYGNWASKKYLTASLDQSLMRTGLEYFDIFYSHRPDPNTPIEETAEALALMVKQGKALYVGISSYNPEQTRAAVKALAAHKIKPLIHQPNYSMYNRTIENGLLDALEEAGMGTIVFCPLAQGLLTNKYFTGIPEDSRVAKGELRTEAVTAEKVEMSRKLNLIAAERNQSLAQLALSWALRDSRVTSALIGASRPGQIQENVDCLKHPTFTESELNRIDAILSGN